MVYATLTLHVRGIDYPQVCITCGEIDLVIRGELQCPCIARGGEIHARGGNDRCITGTQIKLHEYAGVECRDVEHGLIRRELHPVAGAAGHIQADHVADNTGCGIEVVHLGEILEIRGRGQTGTAGRGFQIPDLRTAVVVADVGHNRTIRNALGGHQERMKRIRVAQMGDHPDVLAVCGNHCCDLFGDRSGDIDILVLVDVSQAIIEGHVHLGITQPISCTGCCRNREDIVDGVAAGFGYNHAGLGGRWITHQAGAVCHDGMVAVPHGHAVGVKKQAAVVIRDRGAAFELIDLPVAQDHRAAAVEIQPRAIAEVPDIALSVFSMDLADEKKQTEHYQGGLC